MLHPNVSPVLILLPPSEGKTAPRRGKPLDLGDLSLPALTPARERVLDALVTLCAGDPAQAAAVLGRAARPSSTWSRLNARAPHARRPRGPTAVYAGVLYDALGARRPSRAACPAARDVAGAGDLEPVRAGRRRPTGSRRTASPATPSCPASAPWPASGASALGPAVERAVGDGLLVDLRSGMYAAFWRPPAKLARRVATVRVLHEVAGQAPGGQPLQQGDQGPDRPRAARGRREPAHAGAPGRGAARPRLDRRGGAPARRARSSSTWWSASSEPRGLGVDDPDGLRGRLAVLLGSSDEQPATSRRRSPESRASKMSSPSSVRSFSTSSTSCRPGAAARWACRRRPAGPWR